MGITGLLWLLAVLAIFRSQEHWFCVATGKRGIHCRAALKTSIHKEKWSNHELASLYLHGHKFLTHSWKRVFMEKPEFPNNFRSAGYP